MNVIEANQFVNVAQVAVPLILGFLWRRRQKIPQKLPSSYRATPQIASPDSRRPVLAFDDDQWMVGKEDNVIAEILFMRCANTMIDGNMTKWMHEALSEYKKTPRGKKGDMSGLWDYANKYVCQQRFGGKESSEITTFLQEIADEVARLANINHYREFEAHAFQLYMQGAIDSDVLKQKLHDALRQCQQE